MMSETILIIVTNSRAVSEPSLHDLKPIAILLATNPCQFRVLPLGNVAYLTLRFSYHFQIPVKVIFNSHLHSLTHPLI